MAMRWTTAQQDLFEARPPGMALAPAQRAKALEQLQALLMEAMAGHAGAKNRSETDDDQDHA
jgi:hypothetical protein